MNYLYMIVSATRFLHSLFALKITRPTTLDKLTRECAIDYCSLYLRYEQDYPHGNCTHALINYYYLTVDARLCTMSQLDDRCFILF